MIYYSISGANRNRDTQLQVWSKNNTDAQKWTLDANGSLISKLTGYAVDATDNRRVKTWDRNGSDPQVWILGYNSPSYFFLQNIQSGLVLGAVDDRFFSTFKTYATAGTQVKMWTKNSTSSFPKEQVWKFTEDGYLQSALSPDLVLDIQVNVDNPGEELEKMIIRVKLNKKNDTDTQKWSFQADARGGILRSNYYGCVLEDMTYDQSSPPSLRNFNMLLTQKWTMVSLPHSKGSLLLTDVTIPQGKLVLPFDLLSTFFICTALTLL
jgi:hypothetical protein